MRYELSDHEWTASKPMLPNKPRGVPRVNDRRVLNRIFWISRSAAPWRDLPNNFGPYKRVASKEVQQSDLFIFNEEQLRGIRLKWPKGGFSPLEDDEHADQG